MPVEQDPSSQFVDFTNATASEQLISDLEQALIGWQLSGKGHASFEALSAAFPNDFMFSIERPSTAVDTAVWTKELQYQPAGDKTVKSYRLMLFVSKRDEIPPREPAGSAARKVTKWQRGLEHFTPTMLSVADASRDFKWLVKREKEVEKQEDEREASERVLHDTFSEDNREAKFSRQTTFENVEKWFGVSEFLLLSRSPRQETKETEERKAGVESEDGRRKHAREFQHEKTGKGGVGTTSISQDQVFMADIYIDQNEAGMLLSAMNVALNNCNCTIPAFVPVLEPSRGMWIGSAVPGATGNVSMSFETDSVTELNPHQSYISGLLDFFKVKLQLPPQVEEQCRVEADTSGEFAIGMAVSASFRYSWERSSDPREVTSRNHQAWRTIEYDLPTPDQHRVSQIASKLFGNRRAQSFFGASNNPLVAIDLTVSWPQLREGTYVDNVVHSTLNPDAAPHWMLGVRFVEMLSENPRKPSLPLSKQVANLVRVFSNTRELNEGILVSELAPPMPAISSSSKPSAGCDGKGCSEAALQEPSSSISDSIPAARAAVVLGNALSSLVSAATWKCSDADEIRRIVSELFDDVKTRKNHSVSEDFSREFSDKSGVALASMPSSVQHGAPLGELVSIVATRMSQLHSINSMALLWVEFVKALRDRWLQQQLLPFMSTCTNNGDGNHNASSHSLDALFLLDPDAIKLPTPDFRQCLLHQKLQLLNICILSEAQALKPATTAPFNTLHEKRKCFDQEHIGNDSNLPVAENERDVDDAGSCPSDDEFFDSIEQDQVPRLSLPRCREGILCEAVGVVCLQTNEPLFEPRIQTCVPMTEDVAKEQQDLLTRLGASIESDKLRQQLQSTTLISDMQAFKAANHRCCLADFIRWYSPKDWIPFETLDRSAVRELPPEGRGVWWFEEHGMLSERMRFGSGREHIWHQMWEASAPIPASRQKRTFDPVQESEKIFHYLETLAPHELFHQMLAGAISSGVFALETALPVHVSATTLPVVYSALKTLRSHGNRSIFLLDEVLAQSQVAFTAASRRKVNEQEASNAAVHQCQQHQVAFEMALDALWKFVHSLEVTEVLVTKALSLCKYFLDAEDVEGSLSLVNLLLVPSPSHQQLAEISELLKKNNLRQLVTALVLSTPEVGPPAPPVQREYVLRCICPRPFLREYYGDENCLNTRRYIESEELEEMPLVVSRMYAAFKKQTVRFALVLAESEF